jgi:putative intracellular protease/amidase
LPAHDPARPTAALVLSQAGTETTDFLAPYAILSASEAFNVYALAPEPGPAPVNGGLGILPHMTFDGFDAAHPDGADVVVVPNILDPENPAIVDWVRRQGQQRAVVASICEGARVLARTGLIDGREATTHFFAVDELRQAYPSARWRNDVRYVSDDKVVMSAGISAAVEASLHLVERYGGAAAAERAAQRLGLRPVSGIESPPPDLSADDLGVGLLNGLFVWPRPRVNVSLRDGVDEIALATALDAYLRTYAVSTGSAAPGRRAQRSRHGLMLVPARASDDDRDGDVLVVEPVTGDSRDPVPVFDVVLRDIAARYGGPTAQLVADQLQYPAAHLHLDQAGSQLGGRLAMLAVVLAVGALVGLGMRAVWRRRRASRSVGSVGSVGSVRS